MAGKCSWPDDTSMTPCGFSRSLFVSCLAFVDSSDSTDKLPYVAMGSGNFAAMAIMEAAFKDGMTVRTVASWLSVCGPG